MFRNIVLLLLPLAIVAIKMGQSSNQIVISPDDPYWTDECRRDTVPQSPINIKPPFTFMDFAAEFNFQAQTGGRMLNDGGFNLRLDGDFGNFKYNNKIFNSYELAFKSPSEHTFGAQNQRFALEMQIASISPEGIRIMISIMFSKSDDDGEFLANFGFGDGLLQHLTTNQYYDVKKPIDISEVIPTDNKYFIYEGTRTTPPCEPALWFIAYQTYKISDAQLNDFPKQLLYKDRAITIDQREVYSTFDPKKESATTTSKNTAAETNVVNGASTVSEETPSSKAKSQNVDSFEIVGDDTPYGDEIYPALRDIPNPRPLKNEDYIVVTSAGDPRPYLDYLKLNTDKVNTLLNDLEDEKVTKNMQRAKRDFDALDASGLVDNSGPIDGQADMEQLDSVLKDLSLDGKDAECTIADVMPQTAKDQVNENAATSETSTNTSNTSNTTNTGTINTASSNTASPAETTDTIEMTQTPEAAEITETAETVSTPEATEAAETAGTVETAETTETDETTSTADTIDIGSAEGITSASDRENRDNIDSGENVEEAAFLAINQMPMIENGELNSPDGNMQTNKNVQAPTEKVVSVINHHENRDPSSFFSSLHKKPVAQKNDLEKFLPLSFLELNSNSKNALKSSIYSIDFNNPSSSSLPDIQRGSPIGDILVDQQNKDIFNRKLGNLKSFPSQNTNVDHNSHPTQDQGLSSLEKAREESIEQYNLPKEAEISPNQNQRNERTFLGQHPTENHKTEEPSYQDRIDQPFTIFEAPLKSQTEYGRNQVFRTQTDEITSMLKLSSQSGLSEVILPAGQNTNAANIPVSDNANINLPGAKSEQSDTGTRNGVLQENNQTVSGPEVSGSVQIQTNSQDGRGSMAYNQEKKWDGFNILDTSKWPDLCKTGRSQSPINIDFSTKFKDESNKVTFAYEKPTNTYCELKNDGFKVVLSGSFGSAKYGDHPFHADEIHFHYPSEHTFGDNMERTEMEIQIIHRDNYGLMIAIAFFLKASDQENTNSFLSELGFVNNGLADNLLIGKPYYIESSKVDLSKLVKEAYEYIKYEGSLTSPPCSENVHWFLFNKRILVGKESIEKFKKVLGQESNIRGLQRMNDRDLYIF